MLLSILYVDGENKKWSEDRVQELNEKKLFGKSKGEMPAQHITLDDSLEDKSGSWRWCITPNPKCHSMRPDGGVLPRNSSCTSLRDDKLNAY